MPPKINLQRAAVAPEFIEVMIALYAEWITKNERVIRQSIGTKHEHFAHSGRRMMKIVKRKNDSPRAGLDYEIARLRGLPYREFFVVEDVDPTNVHGPRIPWLAGHTRFVTMTYHQNRNDVKGYMGCYTIYIPASIVRNPDIDTIHMIPDRNPNSVNRHPHHYLNVLDGTRIIGSPLAYPTGNCFGDYSGVIKGMVDEPDFPELFRQLYGHLSTYGVMPPRSLSSLDFDITTPER